MGHIELLGSTRRGLNAWDFLPPDGLQGEGVGQGGVGGAGGVGSR